MAFKLAFLSIISFLESLQENILRVEIQIDLKFLTWN